MKKQKNSAVVRTMTILSLVALMMVATAGDLFAQQGSGQKDDGQQNDQRRQRRGEQMVKQMVDELELNADQEKQVREITSAAFKEVTDNREQYGDDKDAMTEASRNLIAKMNKDIEEVLTEGQQEKFREMRREFRRKRGGNGGKKQGNGSGKPSE